MDADYTGDMGLDLGSAVPHAQETVQTNTSAASLACLTNNENQLDVVGVLTYLASDPGAWPNVSNCTLPPGVVSLTELQDAGRQSPPMTLVAGRAFYAWFTPLVLFVGVIGNSLSLCVFRSRNMRSLSASTYLAALSTADLTALIFYVLVEWLIRGLPLLRGDQDDDSDGPGGRAGLMAVNGSCQMVMYLHYVSRFLSAWLVVAFTVERYIGVCHPLRRRDICTTSSTRRLVLGLVLISFLVNVYKPLLSQVQHIPGWGSMCTSHPSHRRLSFVLDSLYAVMITFAPFVIITVFNLLIIRKLLRHNKARRQVRVVTEESVIRLEFTLILLAVSFCFVALNVPYFAVWLKLFLTSQYIKATSGFTRPTDLDYFRGVAFITRAIFYINYCINFFLYSVTGAYFRRELKMLFVLRPRKYRYGSSHQQQQHHHHHHHHHHNNNNDRDCDIDRHQHFRYVNTRSSRLAPSSSSSSSKWSLPSVTENELQSLGLQETRSDDRQQTSTVASALLVPFRLKDSVSPPVKSPKFPFLGRPVSLSNS